jgi:hypothetical protein
LVGARDELTAEGISPAVQQLQGNDGQKKEQHSVDEHEFEELHHDLPDGVLHDRHVLVRFPEESEDLDDSGPAEEEVDQFVAEGHEGYDCRDSHAEADDIALVASKVAVGREVDALDQTPQHHLHYIRRKTDVLENLKEMLLGLRVRTSPNRDSYAMHHYDCVDQPAEP